MRPIRRLLPMLPVLALAVAAPLDAAKLHMFVTSAMGPGNFAAWPDSDNHSGLLGGDTICQNLALDAGLANPTAYRAYLSDGTSDAYCRLHGLTGKKSANCGQPALPTSAGPWWRTDGRPFAADLPELLSPHYVVLLPPAADQNGVKPPPPYEVWTGTDHSGTASASTCSGWTSPGTETGAYGFLTRTGYIWGSGYVSQCSYQRRLYCFETGDGDPLPVIPANGPLAFLTDAYGYGDLSAWPQAGGETGIAAGDEVCRVLATYAGLRSPESFKAWLSDSTTDAASRFTNTGPWVRLDGMLVAASLADLLAGKMVAPINVLETGYYSTSVAWTGTLADGGAAAETCDDWASDLETFDGRYGLAVGTLTDWTDFNAHDCDLSTKRLYCLHDVPLLFFDDFESAGLWAWSTSAP